MAEAGLTTIHDRCFVIAAKKGHALRAFSLVLDHLLLASRGDIWRSLRESATTPARLALRHDASPRRRDTFRAQ